MENPKYTLGKRAPSVPIDRDHLSKTRNIIKYRWRILSIRLESVHLQSR